jgi:RNA recognition motif-containing protein
MLSDRPLPDSEATVQFQGPVPSPEPKTGLLVRNLGPKSTESYLFDLFVQFGPVYSCTVNVRARSEVSATLQYFVQGHAQTAMQEMVRIKHGPTWKYSQLIRYILARSAFDSTARRSMVILCECRLYLRAKKMLYTNLGYQFG